MWGVSLLYLYTDELRALVLDESYPQATDGTESSHLQCGLTTIALQGFDNHLRRFASLVWSSFGRIIWIAARPWYSWYFRVALATSLVFFCTQGRVEFWTCFHHHYYIRSPSAALRLTPQQSFIQYNNKIHIRGYYQSKIEWKEIFCFFREKNSGALLCFLSFFCHFLGWFLYFLGSFLKWFYFLCILRIRKNFSVKFSQPSWALSKTL